MDGQEVRRNPEELSILATVLTYNAPDALLSCLQRIQCQSRSPDAVLVVDNASRTPAVEVISSAGLLSLPKVEVLREPENGGPAGGHAAALRVFLASNHDAAWVMDDDCLPDPDCLQELLRASQQRTGPPYVFPQWIQPDGTVTHYPAWCGFLIGRTIVEAVGLPLAELFWWAEDTEYLYWRIPQAGYPFVHAPSALVEHTKVRQIHGNPPWKYYYEARNSVYFHLHIKRRLKRLPRKLAFTVARALFREERGRLERLLMVARGVIDGILGRLGKRVGVDAGWGETQVPSQEKS